MPPDRPVLLILAVIGLFVLIAGAANIADPTFAEGGGSGLADLIGGDIDEQRDSTGPHNETINGGAGTAEILSMDGVVDTCVEEVTGLTPMLFFFTLIFAGGIVLAQFRHWVLSLALVSALIPLTVLSLLLLTAGCDSEGDDETPVGGGPLGDVGETISDTTPQVTEFTTDPIIVLLALLGVGLVAIALVTLRDDFAMPRELGQASQEKTRVGKEEIATIAGRTADRLETRTVDVELDNEIYRAWLAMTKHLDVESPETSTPGDFAQAAVDAGMEPTDVNALTRLFEDVRYGDEPVTGDREREAVEVLRRIERSYGGTDG